MATPITVSFLFYRSCLARGPPASPAPRTENTSLDHIIPAPLSSILLSKPSLNNSIHSVHYPARLYPRHSAAVNAIIHSHVNIPRYVTPDSPRSKNYGLCEAFSGPERTQSSHDIHFICTEIALGMRQRGFSYLRFTVRYYACMKREVMW